MKKIKITSIKPKQWDIYKEIKLKSLITDPIAFALKYEQALAYSDSEWKQKLAKKGSTWLVAKYGKKIVGTIGASAESNVESGGIVTIVGFYVAPEYRGLGIGKKLMNKVLGEIKAHEEIIKAKICVSETQKPAINLYENFGFYPTGKSKKGVYFKGKYFDKLIMEKFI